jgi:hypothetical protein
MPANRFSDPLTTTTAAHVALAGTALATGPGQWSTRQWSSTPGVTRGANGASSSASGGAHHAIPLIAGIISVAADIDATGSGFTGIALGRGDLSGDFWVNNDLLFFVRAGGYGLLAGKANLIPRIDPALLKAGANHLELSVDTVARTVSATLNGTAVLTAAPLPASVHSDGLNAAGFRYNEPVTAGAPRVSGWSVDLASRATTGLVPLDHAMCFVVPDAPTTLRWRVAAVGPTPEVPYEVSDYSGAAVAKSTALLADDGTVSLTRTFAAGYYEVTFPAAHQTFGIVALAPCSTVDPFFCIDAGLSWLETDPARRDALVRVLKRCGIAQVRERMGLGGVNPEPEAYVWDRAPRNFGAVRATYAANGMPLLEILEGGGRHHAIGKDSPFPRNLPAVATSWSAIAEHWQPGWGAAEAGNEPDLRTVPAEQYVPGAKALSYALAQAGDKTPLVTGVFAGIPPGPYFDACVANGMLHDSDAVSFHSYDRAPGVENMVARYRTWLATAGQPNLPLWHSECGWPWVNGPGRPPRDQDVASACEIAAKAIESKACGVARHFPFVYVYYEEGQKNFGMMGREATPLRSMAAYAMSTAALAGQPYLGDLRGVPANVTLARVFGAPDAATWVATLYTGNPSTDATVSLPFPVLRAAGADGRALPCDGRTVPVPDGLTYVWLAAATARSALVTDTPTARLYALGQHPQVDKRRAAPVVLQFLTAQTPSRPSARCYLVSQDTARALPLHVQLDNLGTTATTVTPTLTLPGLAPQALAPVTLPPHGSTQVEWTVDASTALDIAAIRYITVTAAADTGPQATALAIPFVMEGTLEQHLAAHPQQRRLPITELGRWQANNADHSKAHFSLAETTWRVDVNFNANRGNWSYPKFTLPAAFDATRDAGFILRARILHPAGTVALMANPNQPDSFWCPDLFPADGQWHAVYVPFTEFKPGPNGAGMQNTRLDPASWRILAIGMGSAVEQNAMEISDLLVVGGDSAK